MIVGTTTGATSVMAPFEVFVFLTFFGTVTICALSAASVDELEELLICVEECLESAEL